MTPEEHEIISLVFTKFDSFQTLWTMYITVVLGFLGYLAAAPNSTRSELVRVLLCIAFTAYAYVNLDGLLSVHEQRVQLKQAAIEILAKGDTTSAPRSHLAAVVSIGPPERRDLVTFHLFCDAIVILTILILPSALIKLNPGAAGTTQVKPPRSPLPPVLLTWDQLARTWTLTAPYLLSPVTVPGQGVAYVFVIPTGFSFDLASIPRLFWWLIAPFELSLVAPLIHDFVYRYGGVMPQGAVTDAAGNPVATLTRTETDDLFATLMRIEGVSWWRRFLAYHAVHIVGGLFWATRPPVAPGS